MVIIVLVVVSVFLLVWNVSLQYFFWRSLEQTDDALDMLNDLLDERDTTDAAEEQES